MSVELSEDIELPEHEKLIGTVLANRYQVETLLGEGAMGAVYKARHVKVGRPFAVKLLHRHLLEDKKLALRFEREAALAGRLRHPNVIGVVDVGETPDGWHYMVMDFAAGVDLATLLDEAPMKPERIIHLVRQMLEGLYHAHEQGLIHRDFKPENVIVELDDHGLEVPRIVDFGIALLREGGDSTSAAGRLTTKGLVLGTPHYMAPEQAVADPIDHRIDLFALGIVIYEMLSGRLPFDGRGAEVARANLLLDPPPIVQRVPYLEVDPLLEAYAHKLMAKKREHRPANAKAARELLDLIERDRPAAAATLGMPLAAASREPAVTQDVAPPPRVKIEEVVVPPEPIEAPPMARHAPPTTPAEPLPWKTAPSAVRRGRAKWVALGSAAVVGVGAALTIALSAGPPIAQPQLPVQATAPGPGPHEGNPPPKDSPILASRGRASDRSSSGPTPEALERTPSPLPQTPGAATVQRQAPPAPAVTPKHKRPKRVVTSKSPPTAPASATGDVKPPAPPAAAAETRPPPPAAVKESDVVIALYRQVRSDLNAAEKKLGGDKFTDVESQLRLIQILDAIKTPETMAQAKAKLRELRDKIAARLK